MADLKVNHKKKKKKKNAMRKAMDKPNKMAVRLAKTQISLGIRPVWSVFAARMKKSLGT